MGFMATAKVFCQSMYASAHFSHATAAFFRSCEHSHATELWLLPPVAGESAVLAVSRLSRSHRQSMLTPRVSVVFSGGVALGAYQAGAHATLHDHEDCARDILPAHRSAPSKP